MNKFFKFSLYLASALVLSAGFVGCDDDDDPVQTPGVPETENKELTNILTQYANNTVVATYSRLADASLVLEDACENLYNKTNAGNATIADVQKACDAWIASRVWWERSEAFLLGPANIMGIDPHIDSWPLDKAKLDNLLASEEIMKELDAEYITTNLGSGGLCGFHALEYVIYKEGKAKPAEEISADLAKFAYAVSGDLSLQCLILEAAWAGADNVASNKLAIMEAADAVPDGAFRDNFINAGKSGSRYRTQLEALVEAIKSDNGCFGIAAEVGDTKISDPVKSQDVLDVESWYSFNSKADFQDNIRGIENVIMGGLREDGLRNEAYSIYTFLKAHNTKLAEELKQAIATCIGEDGTTGIGTIKYPFRDHLSEADNAEAIKSCQDLNAKLEEVASYIQENL